MVELATIRSRGEYQWEAQIRRKGYPAQRKTFETKSDAQAWARMIESEIDRGIFVSRVEAERTAFHQLIDRYVCAVARHGYRLSLQPIADAQRCPGKPGRFSIQIVRGPDQLRVFFHQAATCQQSGGLHLGRCL
ncbi:hypothetical protein [Pseudomonas sp. CVAP|uniref:hypothetical protein n=1 Tax=Pseudomonas sp. CVAP\|nr:hypothetical protein [Pseudomonas sp. CVAP\